MPTSRDLVIVGGGPAGLSAALAAARLGVDVTLLDSGAALGGQLWRQPAAAALPEHPAADPDSAAGRAGGADGARRALRVLRAVAGHPRVEVITGATVCRAGPGTGTGATFLVERAGDAWTLDARTVVLATGATELSLPFPGWDLPGVLTPGGAQALLKAHGVLAGSRILVAGTGPFLWPVAAGLTRAGARIVALVDAAKPLGAGRRLSGLARHPVLLGRAAGYLRDLAVAQVPVLAGRAVVAAHGRDAVESATVARLDERGRPRPDGRRTYTVDTLCVGWGFVPSVELARSIGCAEHRHPTWLGTPVAVDADQATSVPGVFAAGEVTGIGGAAMAWWEGTVAGAAAARELGTVHSGQFAARTRAARRWLRHARHAARLMDRGFPVPQGWPGWLTPDTVFCRCEEVTWQQISGVLDEGGGDVRTVKGLTRCGMGWCQGRICGPALRSAVALHLGRPPCAVGDLAGRPLASPIPLGLLERAAEPAGRDRPRPPESDRPGNDRPEGNRPEGNRPGSDQPGNNQPEGDRPG
jgi:thioredoxin reductase